MKLKKKNTQYYNPLLEHMLEEQKLFNERIRLRKSLDEKFKSTA